MRLAPVVAAAALAAIAVPAVADFLPIGEKAPLPEVKETVNLKSFSPADLDGKVVLYDIFRTW
jgi:hypothetical protein